VKERCSEAKEGGREGGKGGRKCSFLLPIK
jgi:hypothetical protein